MCGSIRRKDREAAEDFPTAAIRLDANHVGAYKSLREIYSRHEQFQAALDDSEKVLARSCHAERLLQRRVCPLCAGPRRRRPEVSPPAIRKDPDPQTRGYYETEVRKVLAARQPRRNSGGGYATDGRESTAHDREMERQQRRP